MVTAQLPLLEQQRGADPDEPQDPDARAVLRALRSGRRLTRGDLMIQTALADRSVRAAIEMLRREGWPVTSSSDRPGYRLSWDPSDLDRLEQDLRNRALSALRTRSAIRRARRMRVA